MSDFCAMSAEELTLTATLIANQLACGKNFDEIMVLRNLTSLISQTLFTVAAQRQFLERNCKAALEPESASTFAASPCPGKPGR